jgi:hypothetical protein
MTGAEQANLENIIARAAREAGKTDPEVLAVLKEILETLMRIEDKLETKDE